MKHKNHIQEELSALGIHLPEAKNAPMSVPENYFETFSSKVFDEINLDDCLATLPKRMPFEVPKFYFDDFEASIQNELQLASLPKGVPFEVPQGYFENLSNQVQAKIQKETPQLHALKPFRSKTSNWAIAASLLLFFAIGFGMMNQKEKFSAGQQLAALSDSEIQTYIEANQAEFDIDLATEQDLNIQTLDVQQLEKDIIETQLNNLPAEEIAEYL